MSNKPDKLSIIFVNYRSEKLIKSCMQSIVKYAGNIIYEIIAVNNDEKCKGLNDLLAETFKVNVIEPGGNIGFSAANNLAVNNANGEYLLFVNPDVVFVEDIFTDILSFIAASSKAGACAPMLIYENEKYQNSAGFRYGFIYELFEIFMFNKLYRALKKYYFLYFRKSGNPVRAGWVSAACMFIKTSVFKELKGFDGNIFLNYEDLDLCRRAEDQGYNNYYFPSLKCIHLDHKSFNDDYEKLIYQSYKSRYILSKKYYSSTGRSIIKYLNMAGILIRIFFVKIIYKGIGRNSRLTGYRKSFALYKGVHA